MELSYFKKKKELSEGESVDPKEVGSFEGELNFQELFEKIKSYGDFGKQEATLLQYFRDLNPKITKVLALCTLMANASLEPPGYESEIQTGGLEKVRYKEEELSSKDSFTDDESASYGDTKETIGGSEKINQKRRKELLSQTSGVTIGMVEDGAKKRKYFSPQELSGGVVEISGYITGIRMGGSSKIEAYLDGEPFNVEVPRGGNKEGYEIREEGNVYGGNWSVRGIPKNANESIILELDDDKGDPVQIEFSQAEFVEEIGEVHVPNFEVAGDDTLSSHIDTTHIATIGVEKEEIREIPDWKEKFRAAGHAVAELESTFKSNIIDSLGVVGYGRRNATLILEDSTLAPDQEERTAFFFKPWFRDLSVDQIAIMARHESLHMLDADRGYSESQRIKELFTEIHGFPKGSQLYRDIMLDGWLRRGVESELDNTEFFTTIDEKNFISDGHGGHSMEGVSEFVATFINTLHHSEDLSQVLSEVRKSAGDSAKRSKRSFINEYVKTLDAFLDVARKKVEKSDRFQADIEFFVKKRREIKKKIAEAGVEEYSVPPLPPEFKSELKYE